MFAEFVNGIYSAVSKIPFDSLVWFVWGSYLCIFLIAFVATVACKRLRGVCKRPFLCLTNAYAACNLALYLLACDLAQSVLITALFWVAGYILYGALCAVSAMPRRRAEPKPKPVEVSVLPPQPPAAPPAPPKPRAEVPAVKNSVRLEHAVSVTEKLLSKNLGKSDRQELEKLKNTLAVLQIKGTLSPTEADILNENFNALLKLMAKYNV